LLDRETYDDKRAVDLQDTEERRLVQIDRIFSSQQAATFGKQEHISASVLSMGNTDLTDAAICGSCRRYWFRSGDILYSGAPEDSRLPRIK
jgi:hypothetical protein